MVIRFKLQITPDMNYVTIPLSPEGSARPPLRAFISLCNAGNMHFQKRNDLPHRNDLFHQLGIDSDRVYSLVQKHTQDVVFIQSRTTAESLFETIGDGLVTSGKTQVLTVTVADCLPVFIVDKRTYSFGIVHSGWKGTGIVMNAVRLMELKLGSRRCDIRVVIGPGIGPCCYRVDEERAVLYASQFGENAIHREQQKFMLDMTQANVNLLAREGIDDIMVCTDCTSCNPYLSSYRRDGKPDFIAMLAGISFKNILMEKHSL